MGKSEAGESIYYAGGADGANAILAFADLSTGQAATFVGKATVGDSTSLTVTDSTTGSSISFAVRSNGDGTITFDLGSNYGTATLSKSTSTEIVNALTQIALASASTSTSSSTATQ